MNDNTLFNSMRMIQIHIILNVVTLFFHFSRMEAKIIEAIKKDATDILISLLPDNQILNYIFTNNIKTNELILHNCPPIHCVAAYFGSVKCLQLLFDQGDRFKTLDKSSKSIFDFCST